MFTYLKLLFFIGLVYPVGFLALNWLRTQTDRAVAPSVVLGLFIISAQSYLLGHMGLFGFSEYLIIFQGVVCWWAIMKQFQPTLIRSFPIPPVSWVFIFLSTYLNSLMLVPFGKLAARGISLFGAHFVDNTWHLALIHSLNRSFPPQNPLFSGAALSNYHYLIDLQISLIHRFTGLPVQDLFFRLVGPAYLLMLSILIYRFGMQITNKIIGGISALILIMVTSNLYYLINWFFPSAFKDPSVMWIDFFTSKVVNYPLLVSLSLVFVYLDIIWRGPKLTLSKSVVFGLLSGLLFLVKSHTAAVWVAGLFLVALGHFTYLPAFLVSCLVIVLLARITISSPAQALQFHPFWFIRVMYESTDHLNFPIWELRRQTLLSLHAYLGVAKLYLQGIAWFIIINFGPLLVGFIAFFRFGLMLRLRLLLFGLLLAGSSLTMAFIYTSTANVTIQFIYPAIISLALLTSVILSKLSRAAAPVLLIIVWIALLPGIKIRLSTYQHLSSQYNVSSDFVSVLALLQRQSLGTVMTSQDLWSGSTVSAFSGQPVYVGDLQILDSLGVNQQSRRIDTLAALTCASSYPGVSYFLTTAPLNCYRLLGSSGTYYLYAND